MVPLPVLSGDPDAVPVLIDLLGSPSAKARQIAAQGREAVGEPARAALPALRQAIDDEDEEVKRAAEQALYRIDREAAEKAGLRWNHLWGLERQR